MMTFFLYTSYNQAFLWNFLGEFAGLWEYPTLCDCLNWSLLTFTAFFIHARNCEEIELTTKFRSRSTNFLDKLDLKEYLLTKVKYQYIKLFIRNSVAKKIKSRSFPDV